MAAMIAGFEVDFAWLLQEVMHERAFKVTTTYPVLCMVFALCRSAGVPIFHINQIKILTGTVDMSLISDEPMSWLHTKDPTWRYLCLERTWRTL